MLNLLNFYSEKGHSQEEWRTGLILINIPNSWVLALRLGTLLNPLYGNYFLLFAIFYEKESHTWRLRKKRRNLTKWKFKWILFDKFLSGSNEERTLRYWNSFLQCEGEYQTHSPYSFSGVYKYLPDRIECSHF